MSIYSASNRSEDIDPLKQAPPGAPTNPPPNPPTYAESFQQPAPSEKGEEEKKTSKPTVGERFHKLSSKAGWPLNKAANVIGAEGWWPTSVDKECTKAARILHSFTQLDSSSNPQSNNGPLHPTGATKKSMVKIPPSVLSSCAGLAIFNVLRAGAFHSSLAGGSGVVVSRLPDGTWSPPSAFLVTTLGAGFVFGLDVYDCVCVLNTPEQVAAFAKPRVSLGAEGSVTVGPVGTGGHVEAAVGKTGKPVWSYMKSRGLWVGVQIDGTVVLSRADANGVFYGERGITAKRILNGDVAWPVGAKPLFEVLRALEGMRYDGVARGVGMARDGVEERQVEGVEDKDEPQEMKPYKDEPEEMKPYKDEPEEETTPDTDEPQEDLPQYKKEESAEEEKARLARSGF